MTLNGSVSSDHVHDPALTVAEQLEYAKQIKEKMDAGTLTCTYTGIPVVPLAGNGWYKSSGDRLLPKEDKTDSPGNTLVRVCYFYNG